MTNHQAELLFKAAWPCLGFDAGALLSNDRHRSVVRARHIAMYAARMLGGSYPEIGRIFGGRDHGTVIYACKRVNARIKGGDESVRRDVLALLHAVESEAA